MALELAEQIRSVRRLRGRETIEEFASVLGVAPKTLSNYELGKRLPDIDFLAHFAQITGASLPELVNLRLQAEGFDPLPSAVSDTRADYKVSDPVDCARHAREALLEANLEPQWALAIMELAAKGDITPAGVDRLVFFIKGYELDPDTVMDWIERETDWHVIQPGMEHD